MPWIGALIGVAGNMLSKDSAGETTSTQTDALHPDIAKYVLGNANTVGALPEAMRLYQNGGWNPLQNDFNNWRMGVLGQALGYKPSGGYALGYEQPAGPPASAQGISSTAPAPTPATAQPPASSVQQASNHPEDGGGYAGSAATPSAAPAPSPLQGPELYQPMRAGASQQAQGGAPGGAMLSATGTPLPSSIQTVYSQAQNLGIGQGAAPSGGQSSSGAMPTSTWNNASGAQPVSAFALGPAAQAQTSQANFTPDNSVERASFSPQSLATARAGLGFDTSPAVNKLLSGQADNPQLGNMHQANINRSMLGYNDAVTNAMQQMAPAIRSGAVAAGQYGGTRQGIAEGIMGQQLARNARDLGIAGMDAGNQLYGQAYESAQGRMAGMAGQLENSALQSSLQNNQIGSQLAMFNAGQGNTARQAANQLGSQQAMFNAGQSNSASQFNAGQQNTLSQFGAQQANQLGMFNAGQQNDLSKFNSQGAYNSSAQNMDAWVRNRGVDAQFADASARSAAAAAQASVAAGQLDLARSAQQYSQSRGDMQLMAQLMAQPQDAAWGNLDRYAGIVNGGRAGTGFSSASTPFYTNPVGGAVAGMTAARGMFGNGSANLGFGGGGGYSGPVADFGGWNGPIQM